jgi:predicted regulator of Ras-like GTPase activity (Roadblock/LC7/MglB family)
MNAIPVLTIDDVATLDGVLGDFLKKAEAELTVVIDRGGNVISQYGDMTVMDVTIIAALAAGSFAATRELARRIGEVEFNALYHQGNGSHIFMNSVDEETIMITVFGPRTTVGLVRFYSTGAAQQVAQLLKSLQKGNHGLHFQRFRHQRRTNLCRYPIGLGAADLKFRRPSGQLCKLPI